MFSFSGNLTVQCIALFVPTIRVFAQRHALTSSKMMNLCSIFSSRAAGGWWLDLIVFPYEASRRLLSPEIRVTFHLLLIPLLGRCRIPNLDGCTIQHSSVIGSSLFPMCVKRRNTSKPVWTNAVTSLPLWFHVSQGSTTKPWRKPHQEIRKVLYRNFKFHEGKDKLCNCTRQANHLFIRGSREPD